MTTPREDSREVMRAMRAYWLETLWAVMSFVTFMRTRVMMQMLRQLSGRASGIRQRRSYAVPMENKTLNASFLPARI